MNLFVNSTLKIQYHVVKNTHPQTAFSGILRTGMHLIDDERVKRVSY